MTLTITWHAKRFLWYYGCLINNIVWYILLCVKVLSLFSYYNIVWRFNESGKLNPAWIMLCCLLQSRFIGDTYINSIYPGSNLPICWKFSILFSSEVVRVIRLDSGHRSNGAITVKLTTCYRFRARIKIGLGTGNQPNAIFLVVTRIVFWRSPIMIA